jgi:hypothetical protein
MTYPVQAYQLAIASVANSSNGTAVYTGTITGGGSNAFVNMYAQIDGFPDVANGSNNGTYLITASGTTSITVANPLAVSASATATLTIISSLATTGASQYIGDATPNQPLFLEGATSINPALPSGNTGGAPPFSSPPATGTLIVPGAPSGSSTTPRNFEGGWNYTNTELSTQKITASLVTALNDGQSFNFQPAVTPSTLVVYPTSYGGVIVNSSVSNVTSIVVTSSNSFQSGPIPGPSVGNKTDTQSTPSAPSGTYASQGTPQITNAAAACCIAGVPAAWQSFVQTSGAYQTP